MSRAAPPGDELIQSHPGERLARLLKADLTTVWFEHWSGFFPVLAAAWRLIESERPGVLPPIDAGFDKTGEMYFAGRGADWFLNTLFSREHVLDLVEKIMYPAVDHLPPNALERGFLMSREIPAWWSKAIDHDVLHRLASLVLASVDEAVEAGALR